ncbi:hypothetical protein [Lactococcus garvieae]|uniref:Uncharacterized protein n=1 Tax=Lactococcus garvieae TaxID=1363 RepID=A0A1I4HCP0_9LACT|nr:hypothetical protein [Lactococcus garvieae]SFL39463.1 hypothetical protein SAMN05216438_1089 [Lactococcus garvieae]
MKISSQLFNELKNINNLVELREWYHETTEFDNEIDALRKEYHLTRLNFLFQVISGKIKVEAI